MYTKIPILYIFCQSLTLNHFTARPVYLLHGLPFLAVALLTQNIERVGMMKWSTLVIMCL